MALIASAQVRPPAGRPDGRLLHSRAGLRRPVSASCSTLQLCDATHRPCSKYGLPSTTTALIASSGGCWLGTGRLLAGEDPRPARAVVRIDGVDSRSLRAGYVTHRPASRWGGRVVCADSVDCVLRQDGHLVICAAGGRLSLCWRPLRAPIENPTKERESGGAAERQSRDLSHDLCCKYMDCPPT